MKEFRTVFVQVKAANFVCVIVYVLTLALILTVNSILRGCVMLHCLYLQERSEKWRINTHNYVT